MQIYFSPKILNKKIDKIEALITGTAIILWIIERACAVAMPRTNWLKYPLGICPGENQERKYCQFFKKDWTKIY